jgi:Domain of unknown function (DUF6458)
MHIGVSIFLIALGAILTFATNFTVSGLDIDVIGIILMVVGVIGLIVDLAIWGPRRRRIPTGGTVVDERRTYDDV